MRALRRSSLLAFLLVLCCVALSPPLSAQTESAPLPYEDEEFAAWLHGARRFEIIALGAFPLTYLATLLVYDVYKFVAESVRIGTVNTLYAPLFFAPANKPVLTQPETIGLIVAAAVLAVVVAIIDLIIQESARPRVARQPPQTNQAVIRQENVPEPLAPPGDN